MLMSSAHQHSLTKRRSSSTTSPRNVVSGIMRTSLDEQKIINSETVNSDTTKTHVRRRSQSEDSKVLKEMLQTMGVPQFSANEPLDMPLLQRYLDNSIKEENEKGIDEAEKPSRFNQIYDRYGFLVTDVPSPNGLVRTRHVQHVRTPKEKKRMVQVEALRIRKWADMTQNWDYVVKNKSKKLKSRIRKGIPDAFRAQAWTRLSGSRDMKQRQPGLFAELIGQSNRVMDVSHQKVRECIVRDITRTFPRHAIFLQQNGLGQQALLRVLQAYAIFDEEVGYCQGMGFVVGLLLGYMAEEDAFWMLVALMQGERFHMKELFKPGMPGAQCILAQFESLLKLFMPKLSSHLEKENIVPSMYATQWYITLFTYSFPFEVVVRIWDVFLSEGWKAVFRVTLAIMKVYQSELNSYHFEEILDFFRTLPPKLNVDVLLEVAFKMKLKTKQIEKAEADWIALQED